MALRNGIPLPFRPHGLSDTLDGSNVFAGAMLNLQNLIPDTSTDGYWMCRPAATALVTNIGDPWSSGFSSGFGPLISGNNGIMSTLITIGSRIYGMVGTGMFGGGVDAPFCYDLSTAAFVNITGPAAGNLPVTLGSTGDWVPPTMTLVGTKIIVCHQGFASVAGKFFGVIDTTNPAALTWTSGNLTGAIAFTSPPYACGQFNGRAYYLTNPPGGQPSSVFSDSLVPTNCTNANQVLTFDDNELLTATAPLPLYNTSGGIIQALLVFKGVSNIYQITGDSATSNLARNTLNAATGTLAPNTISTTTKGIAFLAPDGLRLIDFAARVSDPIGLGGSGVNIPLISALNPSRACADFNSNIYRITVQNSAAPGSPQQEYWWDFARQIWSGPHTLPARLIVHYHNTFIMAPLTIAGALYQSDITQSATSTFVEHGTQMTWNWQTSMLPDTDQMAENAMVETTLMMAMGAGQQFAVSAVTQDLAVIDTVIITHPGISQTIWGQFNWGQAVWGGVVQAPAPQQLPWHKPIVFRRLSIAATGNSAGSVKVGPLHMRYQQLGYLQQTVNG